MSKWLLLLLSATLYAGVHGQKKGCCTPKQWEGYIGEIIGVAPRFRQAKVFATGIQLSYDFKNSKLAETVHFRFGNKSVSVGLIFDFAQKKMYRFLQSKQKCKTRALKSQFKQFCIPDTAKAIGSFYYGAGNNKLQVTSYATFLPKMKAEAFSEVTAGCIPVGSTVIGSRFLRKYLVEAAYADITPGIKDPSVFNPPDFCEDDHLTYEEAQDEEQEELIVQFLHENLLVY